ncbi:MAG: hypothetical protein ACYS30_06130 [Planctomycetota bacterium]
MAVPAFAGMIVMHLEEQVSKPTVVMKKTKRQLVLNKGAEKFIFRYENGREDKLLDALIEQAKDKRTDFDWFDAAVLSFKLTQSLIGQADALLRERDPVLQQAVKRESEN